MLPARLISQIATTSAKLYLTLLALADYSHPIPQAPASIKSLCAHAHVSRRTCLRALAQLRALRIIEPMPRRRNRPATYLLPLAGPSMSHLAPPNTERPAVAPHKRDLPPVAPPTRSMVSPLAPQTPPPPASNPAFASKNPQLPPMAPHLNPANGAPAGTSLNDPHLLDLLAFLKSNAALLRKDPPHSPPPSPTTSPLTGIPTQYPA